MNSLRLRDRREGSATQGDEEDGGQDEISMKSRGSPSAFYLVAFGEFNGSSIRSISSLYTR